MSMIVALGILGIMAKLGSEFATNSLKAAKVVSGLAEKEDLRRMIRMKRSCSETLKKKGFSSTFKLYNSKGTKVFPEVSGVMRQGNWKIYGKSYISSTGEMVVEVENEQAGSIGARAKLFKNAPLVCP
ncbi:hypothetical protein N9D31_04065 [Oligoflexaceae bacterium]|nr:hypothetical protein [Oligoflexaceae bacterium]